MSISELLRYKFSYFGLAFGIILGVFLTSFIPGKWESVVVLNVSDSLISISKTKSFLSAASKESCAPGLVKSLNVKNNRNMRGYRLADEYYKLSILADSQKEASCYMEAVTTTLEQIRKRQNNARLSNIKMLIRNYNSLTPPKSFTSGDNLSVRGSIDLEPFLLLQGSSSIVVFPASIDRILPAIWRLIVILFSGLVGLIIGMLISNNVLKKNSKKSSDENLKS